MVAVAGQKDVMAYELAALKSNQRGPLWLEWRVVVRSIEGTLNFIAWPVLKPAFKG